MPRLFVGLEIPGEVGQTLSLLRGGLPGARWIDPENYHITLRFIGDIDDRLAHDIALLLDGVKRRSFEVRFGGLTAFGGRKPRAIVVGVEPIQPLVELQSELERLMQRLGLEPEGRKFTPHVTLARLRDAFGKSAETLDLPAIATVSDVFAALRARGDPWAHELAAGRAVRVAVNHDIAGADAVLRDGDEVAFLPPVTGG